MAISLKVANSATGNNLSDQSGQNGNLMKSCKQAIKNSTDQIDQISNSQKIAQAIKNSSDQIGQISNSRKIALAIKNSSDQSDQISNLRKIAKRPSKIQQTKLVKSAIQEKLHRPSKIHLAKVVKSAMHKKLQTGHQNSSDQPRSKCQFTKNCKQAIKHLSDQTRSN